LSWPVRISPLAAALTAANLVSAAAQDHAVSLFAYGGGYSALKNVNRAATAEFKTGFTLGGGIGYEIDKNLELRATLTGAQSQLLEQGAPTSMYLNRYYVAADLKAYYPAAQGITPYGFLGAGAVLLHERGSTGADKTQGFAHLGLGIAYAVGKSGMSILALCVVFVYLMNYMISYNSHRLC